MEIFGPLPHQAGVWRSEREERLPAGLTVLHHQLVSLKLVPAHLLPPSLSPGHVTVGSLQTNNTEPPPTELLSKVSQASSDINNCLVSAYLTF